MDVARTCCPVLCDVSLTQIAQTQVTSSGFEFVHGKACLLNTGTHSKPQTEQLTVRDTGHVRDLESEAAGKAIETAATDMEMNAKESNVGTKSSYELLHDTIARKAGRRHRPAFLVGPSSRSLVAPANCHHPEWLHLTNLDRVVNPTFVSVLFFYEGVRSSRDGDKRSFKEVTTSLKESLAKVLVDFYPLAGRLSMSEETGIVDLHCNDAGAVFLEASANVALADLGGPQPMNMISGMDSMRSYASFGPGLVYLPDQINLAIPVLVIQVTEFKCGSIAVAANWHHSVADGFSGCHFMRSWAQISKGQELTLLPSYDRELLQPRTPLDSSMVIKLNSYSSTSNSDLESTSKPTSEPYKVLEEHPELSDSDSDVTDTVVKCFFLENNGVRRLKESLNYSSEVPDSASSASGRAGGMDENPRFTSVEALSGELWKLMVKARTMDKERFRNADRSRFFMFVDGRKKMGLPPGYFGNVVCSACAESSPDELLQNPLSYAANLIRTAVKAVNKNYFRSLIDWIEEQGITSVYDCKSKHVNSTGNDVAATFWIFFPLYEINFGWGKPVLSVRNAPPRKLIDGISVMPGPDKSGRMVALVNAHTDRMNKLQQDARFLQLGVGTEG